MNTWTIIKQYWRRKSRTTVYQFLAILAFFLTLMWFRNIMFGAYNEYFCTSERNLRSFGTFNKSGIRVIPSVPDTPEIFEEALKDRNTLTKTRVNHLENDCLSVKTRDGRHEYYICIHDPYRDLVVSAHLMEHGSWDMEKVAALHEAYQRFPGIVLVDLGCHIGVLTLPAAKLGMEVVAVDAMLDSLKLLQRSLLVNVLSCHVTLVHNAVHRKRRKMRLVVDPVNMAGAKVVELDQQNGNKSSNNQLVDAICLNDLAPLVNGKTVFLNIDLEGGERYVLGCARHFFSEVNVKVLLLKWAYIRHRSEASEHIIKFLTSQGMVPTRDLDEGSVLDLYGWHIWPDHVIWVKKV